MTNDSRISVWAENPAAVLVARLPALASTAEGGAVHADNPALQAELAVCAQRAGDWLALVILPTCLRLYLLPGGGALWGDIPQGQQRYLELAGHNWRFLAANDERLGVYQFCDLLPSMATVASIEVARLLAFDAARTLALPYLPPSAPAENAAAPGVDRRGFLRGLFRRR